VPLDGIVNSAGETAAVIWGAGWTISVAEAACEIEPADAVIAKGKVPVFPAVATVTSGVAIGLPEAAGRGCMMVTLKALIPAAWSSRVSATSAAWPPG